jgi:hypothetical protein
MECVAAEEVVLTVQVFFSGRSAETPAQVSRAKWRGWWGCQ